MKKDGGPAFPAVGEVYGIADDTRWAPGMSLRDYAEIHFTAALLSNPDFGVLSPHVVRRRALKHVDAMLAEREK